tara:strand:- start:11709 stop:12296 length:588 start_codon:yes stop_codon:yes gene_type:complete
MIKRYLKLRKKVLAILNTNLPKDLCYHDIEHTLDVVHVVNQYIRREKIDNYNAYLLRIAALLHDIGFVVTKVEHEEKSIEIAEQLMLEFDFSPKDIELVKGLIKATRIPQSPKNYLECILCDSDLDYLGRKDFYQISAQLYQELKQSSIVSNKNEWNKAQIKFLETHQYHTAFARKYRQPKKEKRILEIKKTIKD